MRRAWFAGLTTLLLAGCGPKLLIKVDIPAANQAGTAFLQDQTQPDHYPSRLTAEGNIYSCRYGIHFYARDELQPPKQELFAGALIEANPAIAAHHVVLRRFDVYRNYRTRVLRVAGDLMGSPIITGQARKLDAEHSTDATRNEFSLLQDPGDGRGTRTENEIGCDSASEGEYFPAEVLQGSDVIVIWLEFDVDSKPYRFRSTYSFKFVDLQSDDKAVADAIGMTLHQVATKVSL